MSLLKYSRWFAWFVCFLVAVVFSIRNLHEPDIWWMLRTGEWISDKGRVVSEDVFSFTFLGTPWINVKWLFEVIVYKVSLLGGPEFTFMLQMLVNLLFVWLIYKIYLLFKKSSLKTVSTAPTIGLLAASYFALFGAEYRMIGRPEMVSHLFMLLCLYIFAHYYTYRSKWIYLLIPLQLLWTNLHEAFGMGVVIMYAMLGGFVLEYILNRKETKLPVHVISAVVLATLAISINPNGVKMLLHPYEIFTQVGDNKFTTELYSYQTSYYWEQKEPYLMLFLFVIGLIGFVWLWKKQHSRFSLANFIKPVGAGYLVLYFLFFYLALTAHRNVVFFILMSAPLIALTFDCFLSVFAKKMPKMLPKAHLAAYILFIIFGLGFYTAIATNTYYKHFNNHERYGLLVSGEKNPVGAAEFIAQHNIKGKAYSDYLTSSYFLWNLRPEFKTYVDLRDLDVFPAEFITQASQELFYPQAWEASNKKYNFDYVVLYRPVGDNLHRYLYNHPNWQLAFADPVAAVYLPKGKFMAADSLPEDVFEAPYQKKPSGIAKAVTTIFWPFYKPEKPDFNTDALAAAFYRNLGAHELALNRAQNLLNNTDYRYEGLNIAGNLFLDKAQQTTDANLRNTYFKQAQAYFAQTIQNYGDKPAGYEGLGKIFLLKGDLQQAENYLSKAIELSEAPNIVLLTTMAESQRMQMEIKPQFEQYYFDKWLEYSIMAYEAEPENLQIKFTIGLAYCNRNDCENARKYLEGVNGYPGVSQQELQMVAQCKQRCGIQ